MTDLFPWIVLALVAIGAALLTRWLIFWLTRADVLDRPNERSSHVAPTPRGGGLAILIAGAVGILAIGVSIPWPVAVGVAAFAVVSWLDDVRGLPVGQRLIAQFVIVAVCLVTLPSTVGAVVLIVVAFLWIWFLNLFNFMDGIDGISGVETLTICLGVALVTYVSGSGPLVVDAPLIVAAATAGFLIWNWPPAKIFMGDVGSIPLGFLCGWFLLDLAQSGQWAAALILPSYYLADATITLGKRALRKETVWRPHKEHFYQRAHQAGLSHKEVSMRVLIANIALIALAVVATEGYNIAALIGAATVVGILLFHLANTDKKSA